ncbi:hypothetical protein BH09VER1_BH09VER1_37850 [soil metagenome]
MDPYFAELGRVVLGRWKARNFSLEAFPAIATEALEELPPSENVDMDEFIKEFLLNDEQAPQSQSGFGQPELVVYDDPRFYIQVLFWLDGTTQIHQHEFSGAFHVMEGSSIHSLYGFENAQSITAHFRVGDLKLKLTELLEKGDTVPIVSGRDYLHSLFHLDMPSLTVVVRTHEDPGTGPQFTYLPPHVAVDPFFSDALTMRRTHLLDVLEKLDDSRYPGIVSEMVAELDYERGFFVLQNGVEYLRNLGAWDEVWAVFENKHGELAKYVPPTLDGILWRDRLVGMRGSVTDVEHRIFLALLLTVPNREDILGVVEKSFPGDPIDTVMRWAEELSEASEMGTSILDAKFPEGLEVPEEEQAEMFFAALRCFLSGENPAEKLKISASDAEALREVFEQSSLRALVS